MNYGFNTQIIIIHGEKMNPMIKGKLEKKKWMRLLPAKKRTSSKVAKTLRTFMLKYALLKFIRA